ncbi:SDR family NAD(P)-dependent oxidoreductase [Aeromicrobium fastidiosum]|uniref:SDR family oxidoreductase n=1 Tax=Aeromicrobium fastidiosum TaxID=52699 RepID=A0A641AQF4_9ACTN|nr:SDR family oxidoreductase [Aeromicrobium fastidiosum]KAA1379912.1 SDR family oxidoreductase [Aeromicrobium fastidiosum]MBP2389418.1 NAD(P)-dependent dehydrogenase (short-subunit alcohol dehydrogenase family) [Aeromicrobium fastidiosum]
MGDRLKHKIAIVTGAAGAQGRATAELFVEEGAVVYACDVAAADYAIEGVHHRRLDIASEAGWTALVEEIVDTHARVDVLVNNAAVTMSAVNIVDVSVEEIETVLRINVLGATLGTRAVIPSMVAGGSGSIVNISSALARHAAPTLGAYQLSKGALGALTRHVAVSYAGAGVRANTILPGRVETPMLTMGRSEESLQAARATIPLGRFADPREIAYSSLFLACDESSYITGVELLVDGGATA